MKTKTFMLICLMLFIGISTTSFKVPATDEDVYMWLFIGDLEITGGQVEFNGTTPVSPFEGCFDICVSNGPWVIEYATSESSDHIYISDRYDSSDATVYLYPDGTPGTYLLHFYLNSVLMTTLTIVVN
jgi:hypothetical protein